MTLPPGSPRSFTTLTRSTRDSRSRIANYEPRRRSRDALPRGLSSCRAMLCHKRAPEIRDYSETIFGALSS